MRTYFLCIALLSWWNPKSEWNIAASRLDNSKLIFEQMQLLPASYSIKSLVFNAAGTKLYAMNLEGMHIYEFDRESKKMLREISFKPTRANGWDYALRKVIPSYAEKPIEACFSHQDKILWVSLHNAGGIVPLVLDTSLSQRTTTLFAKKVAWITDSEKQIRDTLYLPLIKTGKIPKVIAKTLDSKFLIVSNWGSKSLSILKLSDTIAPYAEKITDIVLSGIPRGIAVDDKNGKSYVAIMGGNKITVIDHKRWKVERNFIVARNPRHLLMTSGGRLFVSFNAISQVACYQVTTGKCLFKVSTHLQPRTIALSEDQKYLFVTCYGGNSIDIFKINSYGFTRIYSLKCSGRPIGIALYEDEHKLEAWVSSFMENQLKVFVFKKG